MARNKTSAAHKILSNMGLIGTPLSTNSLTTPADTAAARDRRTDDFHQANQVDNPDVWLRYAGLQRRPQTYEGQLQLWSEMADWDLISAALVETVDECTQTDSTQPDMLWYEANDREAEDEINDMLETVAMEQKLKSQVWHVAAMGNNFEKIDYEKGEGVTNMSFIDPFDCRRYWLKHSRQVIGFKVKDLEPNIEDVFVHPDNKSEIQRVSLGQHNTPEALLWPWEVMHTRRMFRLRSSEHGEPIFDEAQGIYKKLKLALDQMVVHRAQIQPDRYVVNIDTQESPPSEQMKIVNRWQASLRKNQTFGQGTTSGTLADPDDFRSFYNPLALDTIIYMAKPSGVQHAIDKLDGTTQIPDVFDVELLIDLLYSIMGMPKSWFFGGDGTDTPSGKALLAQDIRFLRKVKSLRKPIMDSYTWLAYFHLLLKGKNINTISIKTRMPDIGGLEDQIKLDLLRTQAEVLQMLSEIMINYNLPKEAWIELIFKKYLHLPSDVVDVFITALPQEAPQQESKAPSEAKLLQEINAKMLHPRMHHLVAKLRQESRKFMNLHENNVTVSGGRYSSSVIIPDLQPKNNDIVVSGFGRVPKDKNESTDVVGTVVGSKTVGSAQMLIDHKKVEKKKPLTEDAPADPNTVEESKTQAATRNFVDL